MLDSRNPYAAPLADVAPFETPDVDLVLKTASQGTRFVNFVVDSILRQGGAIGVGAVVGLVNDTLGIVLMVLIFFGYHVFFEFVLGRTPAKYLTGTRVVDFMGRKPTFWQIVGRTAARFIPFEPFSFFGSSQRGWHDSMSGTRVINV